MGDPICLGLRLAVSAVAGRKLLRRPEPGGFISAQQSPSDLKSIRTFANTTGN
jgi:hypothetical protein